MPEQELIEVLSHFDVGVVLHRYASRNYMHALPNKFFQYVHAGLAVLVSRTSTDMVELAQQYGFGLVLEDSLDVGNTLSDYFGNTSLETISQAKQMAQRAAPHLSWSGQKPELARALGLGSIQDLTI